MHEAQTKSASTVVPNKHPRFPDALRRRSWWVLGAWDLIQFGIDFGNRRHGIYVSHEKILWKFSLNHIGCLIGILIMVYEIIPV